MLRVLALASCVALMAFPAAAEELTADSALKAATVYSSRATLTREATVDIPAGAHTVVFKNLPASLLPESLRAEGKAAGQVTFGALTHKMVMSADLVAPKEKELHEQLETLFDQRKGIEAEKAALAARQEFLTSLSKQAALRTGEEIAEIDLKPDQWAAAAQAVYTGTAEILKGQLVQDIALRGVDRQIAKIRAELELLQTGERSFYEVALPLEAASAGKLTVSLSYQIPEASWTPLYDARLDTAGNKLELIQYGAVRQMTGEDWEDVALTLSTAQPQRGAGLPDLDTMWVGLYDTMAAGSAGMLAPKRERMEARYLNKVASMDMAMEEAAAPMPAAAPLEEYKAQFQGAEIETGGFVSEYRIPGPSTVKADGTESKLMIGTFDTDNEIRIQVKPQISSDAYLVAHTKLNGDAPVLAGPVSLFRDGAFVGQDYLPLLRPGQENDLAFGIDDQVAVKRRTLKDERSEDGVLAKDSVLEKTFVTELQNLHSDAVKIVVLETIPVPQDERIKVEITENATTPGYEKNPDNVTGLLRWEVPLAAKEKKDLKLGWQVSWPKDQSLSGL